MTSETSDMEIELKLLVEPESSQNLRDHPLLKQYAVSDSYEQKLSAIYFDTPDNLIRSSGAGLRVRRNGDTWVQTFKAGGCVAGGLHQRHEWESKVDGPVPNLSDLKEVVDRKTPWGKLLRNQDLEASLQPIFTTNVKRTVWELRLPEGDEVEFVFDQGTLERDKVKETINEIELELKSGDPSNLVEFALELQKDIPLRIGNQSKAERGYALFMTTKPQAVKATKLSLSKKMNIEEAFQAIVQNCLEQIQANEEGVAQFHDVESLHQMRVGLRRLRSALSMFKEVIALPEELQQELTWLGDELGAARDWDVLAGSTLAVIKSEDDKREVDAIRQAALDKAKQMHDKAAVSISSPRYTKFILMISNWIQRQEWRNTLFTGDTHRLREPLNAFVREMLKNDQKRLIKRGSQLKGATPESRHRVRIAAKKMRYDTEFFQSLLPKKEVTSYVKELSALQDNLGWLNDVAVADNLLKDLQSGQTELAENAAFIRGYLSARIDMDEKGLHKLWKQLQSAKLPGK